MQNPPAIQFSTVRAMLMLALSLSMVASVVLASITYVVADGVLISPVAVPIPLAIGIVQIIAEVYGPRAAWRVSWCSLVSLAVLLTLMWAATLPIPASRTIDVHLAWLVLLYGPHSIARGFVGAYLLAGLTLWLLTRLLVRRGVRLGQRLLGPALAAVLVFWLVRLSATALQHSPVPGVAAMQAVSLSLAVSVLWTLIAIPLISFLRRLEWAALATAPIESSPEA